MQLQKLNQRGIAHLLPIIIVLLVISVIGFAVYRVVNKDNNEQSQQNANTEQAPPIGADEEAEPEKTTYNFENSPLQIDLQEGWEVNIEKRFDQTGDGKKESYNGKIKGPDGWAVSFALDQGGFGGGPGCNFDNELPDLPTCPYYKMVSRKKLQTGDYLDHVSLSKPGGVEDLDTNCVVITQNNEYNSSRDTESAFEADGWVCFGSIEIKGSTFENGLPASGRFSVVFPRELNKNTSTDYREEGGFKQAMEILGSLRYR
jgi:hypothetical protein